LDLPPSLLEIRDSVLWLRHLDGVLRAPLEKLPQHTPVVLEIDGTRIEFAKMANGADGRPTHGLKPVGLSREHWKRFWPARAGEVVSVREVGASRHDVAEALAPAPLLHAAGPPGTMLAWLAQELADIPPSDLDSVALLDAVREGRRD
jgi:hypothetical protein